MLTIPRIASTLPFLVMSALAGCSSPSPAPEEEIRSQDAYWAALQSHCGKAYSGQLVSDDAVDADFQGADMVMHVRECSDEQIAIPFHVRKQGEEWDRSRTWVITRVYDDSRYPGLRLKHDHRHEDGQPDPVTMYGGDTAEGGSARIQTFPVDVESIVMFEREGLDASVTNVWSVEVDPAKIDETEDAGTETDAVKNDSPKFTYQLKRTMVDGAPEDRLFRVEFDLSEPIAVPPAPWGG